MARAGAGDLLVTKFDYSLYDDGSCMTCRAQSFPCRLAMEISIDKRLGCGFTVAKTMRCLDRSSKNGPLSRQQYSRSTDPRRVPPPVEKSSTPRCPPNREIPDTKGPWMDRLISLTISWSRSLFCSSMSCSCRR
jgi:hypothetical protein